MGKIYELKKKGLAGIFSFFLLLFSEKGKRTRDVGYMSDVGVRIEDLKDVVTGYPERNNNPIT